MNYQDALDVLDDLAKDEDVVFDYSFSEKDNEWSAALVSETFDVVVSSKGEGVEGFFRFLLDAIAYIEEEAQRQMNAIKSNIRDLESSIKQKLN